MRESLQVVIRTPREVVFDAPVRAMRLPTESGQVGLRPRGEPLVLAVEPGLIVLRTDDHRRFAATAGGLLEATRERATLYAPFAVAGETDAEVLAALDRALAAPEGELVARRRLGELERRIVGEVRLRPTAGRAEHP